jgi:hypothetical protein
VRWTGRESVIETLDSNNVKDIRKLLQELGVRLSDVFGADNVLWVEGRTEEICFPLLLQQAGRSLSAATSVVGMVNTGDFEGRRARRSLPWEVYENLSKGSALIPPALAFSFDREDRTETKIKDMLRCSRGLARFLPRLTYENYLLDEHAISAVLQLHEVLKSPEDVKAWLETNGSAREYFAAEVVTDIFTPKWVETVHAPKLLTDLFDALSVDAPVRYDKVVHSVALTKWLIEHKPDSLTETQQYVVGLLQGLEREQT